MAEEEMYSHPCADAKVVLLGAAGVGKSALALKYVRDEYVENLPNTVGACFFAKRILVDSHLIKLQIWDTAGQERFHALAPLYYRGAVGAILVFDLTAQNTFKEVEVWVNELQQNTSEEMVLAVVGNKSDLYYSMPPDQRLQHVTKAAEAYANKVNAVYMETSAKTGQGIEELFVELTRRIVERNLITIPEPAPAPSGGDGAGGSAQQGAQGGSKSVIRLDESATSTTEPKRCRC